MKIVTLDRLITLQKIEISLYHEGVGGIINKYFFKQKNLCKWLCNQYLVLFGTILIMISYTYTVMMNPYVWNHTLLACRLYYLYAKNFLRSLGEVPSEKIDVCKSVLHETF